MSLQMMIAIRAHDYGGPEQLVLEPIPRPEPKAGEVLVRILAAGVNPLDWKMRAGLTKAWQPLTFPWTPGLDGAGIIAGVGSGTMMFQPGQAVFGFVPGAYAEYGVTSADNLAPKPQSLTFEQAASLPVGALTAWGAVMDAAEVQSGQRVLVQGAAGGVGVMAVQLARWKGAHVLGTSSASNLDFLRFLGVEQAIDYQATPFEQVVHDVDAVIDTVGGEVIDRSLKVLRPDGVLVSIAGQVRPDKAKALGLRVVTGGRASPEHLHQITELIESKQIRAVVGPVFPLAQAGRAQAQSETRHGRGRIVLHIAEE
ncbi:MAG: NADP-dependent oxidoreductase [Anaerolineales bacterium]|jgi:NADPH:quinone reductase-like Zn-dependent oxidoreductase